jgi:S-adenosylmethionine:tRNA ribosyltransferase-isomerase
MKLSDFDYHLPQERIAHEPVHPKSYSKLLVWNKGNITHFRFYKIKDYFKKGDVLVINTSKVKRSRLLGKKETGSPVDIILMGKDKEGYRCRISGKKIRPGRRLIFGDYSAHVVKKEEDIFWISFEQELTEEDVERICILPTPPYIKKKLSDDQEYQTVYSKEKGSIAAPTAGLHYTPNLIKEIRKKGVTIAEVCLHVGFGTFLPIQYDDPTKHKMETEHFEISQESADIINNRKGRLFITGTTSMRSIESATDSAGIVMPGKRSTHIYIYPGYRFKNKPDGFITNFHLPKSTLLLLLSALVGKDNVMKTYEEAIEKKYRFYSLGDSCLFLT